MNLIERIFNVVCNTLVYHHLTEDGRKKAFAEIRRVRKPGGRLIVVDINPTRRNILTALPGHNRLAETDYVRSEVTARMQDAGFTVLENGPHPSRQLSYAVGKKIQS